MTILTVQIEPTEVPSFEIYVNPSVINKLNLPLHKPFDLSFGQRKMKVYLKTSHGKSNLIRIPSNTAKSLLIPNGIQVYAKRNTEELQLGPILGILVQSVDENQPQTPFGKLTGFAQEVLQIAQSKGVYAYLFTMNNLNSAQNFVIGWTYKDNKWKKNVFPVPHVIYNRISSRKLEKKLEQIISKYQEQYDFKFFNSHFLNKWEVYQKLIPTSVHSIMPKTVQYKGALSIKEMLNKYPIIYLKPSNGALGQGIIRIEKNNSVYTVQLTRVQGTITKEFNSFEKMFKYLKPRLNSKNYLVQQGLRLIHFQNRPIDFRILVQKNSRGDWAITSMVARMANDHHIVSNLAQGGTQGTVMETIQLADPQLARKNLREKFKTHALLITEYLEHSIGGHFAEFGIDLALDHSGKIWLLEVNSKPSKTTDPKANEPRPSVNRLIQYVLFLSGFNKKMKKQPKNRAYRLGGNLS